MNANELADELKEVSKHSEPHTQIVLGIAESLLRQQQAEIDNLAIVKYLNGVTISKLYAEIEALKDMLEEEGIGVSQKYLDERIPELGKAQEK